jgi:ZIP family zinc transporter
VTFLTIINSLLSESTIFIGGILSHYFGDHVKNVLVKSEIVHFSVAFDGGILVAVVGWFWF